MDRCSNCVLSTSFPGLELDENGVCNFCRDESIVTTEQKIIDESAVQVQQLIEGTKGKNEYDALVCYSGGKDSTYTLMAAVEKYGMKILSFTLDNGYISPKAFENINKVVETLGVDHFTFKPSKTVFNKMITTSATEPVYAKSSLRRISSGCNTCISIVNNLALKTALEKNIPFILAGFTLGQIPANSIIYRNNYPFFLDSRKRGLEILKTKAGNAVNNYLTISEELQKKTVEYPYVINLLCMESLTENQIIEAITPLGWERPGDVDGCSSNCRLNTFNNIIHQKKFGYSPYELELSHLIRKNQLTREEALEKLLDQPREIYESIGKELGYLDN
ncbi:MAG: hypothetical protein JXR86_04645 [Spirochaetales bacterium]|nr:hypothetical protein [Spirochaetales bacterium]